MQIQEAHETFNLTNEAVAARLKELCWDSQADHVLAVHALARPGVEVRKFGVHGTVAHAVGTLTPQTHERMYPSTAGERARERNCKAEHHFDVVGTGPSAKEKLLLEKLKRMRWLELAHQNNVFMRRENRNADTPGPPQHLVTWAANLGRVGNGCTWVHNHGVRWPGSNVIAMLNAWSQIEHAPAAPEQMLRRSNTFSCTLGSRGA